MAESRSIDVMSRVITLNELENVIEDFGLVKDSFYPKFEPLVNGNKHFLRGHENGQDYETFLEVGKDTYRDLIIRVKKEMVKAVIKSCNDEFKEKLKTLY